MTSLTRRTIEAAMRKVDGESSSHHPARLARAGPFAGGRQGFGALAPGLQVAPPRRRMVGGKRLALGDLADRGPGCGARCGGRRQGADCQGASILSPQSGRARGQTSKHRPRTPWPRQSTVSRGAVAGLVAGDHSKLPRRPCAHPPHLGDAPLALVTRLGSCWLPERLPGRATCDRSKRRCPRDPRRSASRGAVAAGRSRHAVPAGVGLAGRGPACRRAAARHRPRSAWCPPACSQ